MTKLGLALERKMYIDKLRDIEKYVSSKPEDPFLKRVKDILYESNSNFKLQDKLSSTKK
jgi:hypothetical protein